MPLSGPVEGSHRFFLIRHLVIGIVIYNMSTMMFQLLQSATSAAKHLLGLCGSSQSLIVSLIVCLVIATCLFHACCCYDELRHAVSHWVLWSTYLLHQSMWRATQTSTDTSSRKKKQNLYYYFARIKQEILKMNSIKEYIGRLMLVC